MGLKTALAVGVAAVVVVAGGVYMLKHQQMGSASAPIVARLSTPPGVTFQKVKVGKVTMIPGSSSDQQEQVTVYADGKSMCNGPCATNWPPLMAPADAKPSGGWSVVTRDDGSKQWAYKSHPLYTWVKDTKPGDTTGDAVGNVWHTARQ